MSARATEDWGVPPTLRAIKRDQRRRIVSELIAKGRHVSDIAKSLGRSRATIARDVQAIRREMRAQLAVTDVTDIAADELRARRVLEREGWRLFESKDASPGVKLGALQFIAGNRRDLLDAMLRLGVTAEAARKVQVQLVMFERVDALDEERKKELLASPDEKSFLERLSQLVGLELASAATGQKEPLLLAGYEEVVDAEVVTKESETDEKE